LIISAPAEESASLYGQFAAIAQQLKPEEHYTVDEKDRVVAITASGITAVESLTGHTNFYDANNIIGVHHLESALKAKTLFKRDKDYVVRDGEIVIVDEFTGRMMEGRRYSEGLHQAIEAKEGVEVKRESDTLATISFQNFFRMYDKLAGMTGTAETEAEEFWKIYKLDVVSIPTHRPIQRIDSQDRIYKNETAKYAAVVKDVKERSEKGQPVLIGTISVEKNEYLSQLLKKAGVRHELLNAKQHEKEAQVIAQAGRLGAVTVATNMAGRGVDIILGGMPNDKEEARKVRELGGLHVIGTERHESRRIDNQLRGRAGRQGDPGSSIFFVSMEDDLMRIFGGDRMKAIMERLGLSDEDAIEHKMISSSLEQAQKRVEGHNFDIRKHLVEYDDVMNKHRVVIYKKRRRILDYDPAAQDWLHENIHDMLADEEVAPFEAKVKTFGIENMKQLERIVSLRVIDTLWIDHLNAMQELREGIGLRGYGQHDPLVEYKHEAYTLFQRLLQTIDDETVQMIMRAEFQPAQPAQEQQSVIDQRAVAYQGADESMAGGAISNMAKAEPAELMTQSADESKTEQDNVQVRVRQAAAVSSSENNEINGVGRVGRNDLCPCGSGLKFKKCHGK
jgi:preprotein translocase subunit SecA